MAEISRSPWEDLLLEANPEIAYYSSAPFGSGTSAASPWGGGFSPAQQRYWSGQYGDIANQFLGAAGRSYKAGEDPMSFTDYLAEYPWTQRYTALGPSMRPGSGTSRYAPTTRWMY